MSYARERPVFSYGRLALWLINVPVGLAAIYTGLYAFAGLWNADTPFVLWLLAALQPLIAMVAWAFSVGRWSEGLRTSANLALLLPLVSLLVWITAMQVWIRL